MRFVSNRAEYQFVICNELGTWHRDVRGNDSWEVTRPQITARFEQGALTDYEMALAMEHWVGSQGNRRDGTMRGMGAHPMVSAPSVNGEIPRGLSPFRPQFRFSLFDTDSIDDPEIRKMAEEKLSDGQWNGNEHMLVTPAALPEPWPGYDQMKGVRGKPLAESIAAFATATGQVAQALAYESATKQRKEIVAALEAAHAEAVERAIEDDALSAQVPA